MASLDNTNDIGLAVLATLLPHFCRFGRAGGLLSRIRRDDRRCQDDPVLRFPHPRSDALQLQVWPAVEK